MISTQPNEGKERERAHFEEARGWPSTWTGLPAVDRAGPRGKLLEPADDGQPLGPRQPFHPAEETELEPVPGHYKYMLGLPF